MSDLWCNSLSHHLDQAIREKPLISCLFFLPQSSKYSEESWARTGLGIVTTDAVSEGCPLFPDLEKNRLWSKHVRERSKTIKAFHSPRFDFFIHTEVCVRWSWESLCNIKLGPYTQKQNSQVSRPRSVAGRSGTPARTHWEPNAIRRSACWQRKLWQMHPHV